MDANGRAPLKRIHRAPSAFIRGYPRSSAVFLDVGLRSPPCLRALRVTSAASLSRIFAKRGTKMTEKAMFGAGCFWGVEAEFRQVKGVVATAVGYSGGTTENPTYKQVCSGNTGHAEVVQVEYDPSQVTYEELLNVFWENHDPTQMNRQGPDIGAQYRSAIYYYTPEQEAAARASKEALESSGRFRPPPLPSPSRSWRS